MRCTILATALAAAIAAPASATVFYEQIDPNRPCRNNCVQSQVGPYAQYYLVLDQRAYDDFRLGEDRSVATIRWQGFYYADPTHVYGNLPANINTRFWDIAFYADDNGRMASALHQTRLDVADVARERIRPMTTSGGQTVDWLSFTAQLPTAFEAAAGERYWLSIVSVTDDWQSRFSWSSSGLPGNGGYWSAEGTLGTQYGPIANRAFSIGNDGIAAVPEPATWAMMIGGFAFVGMTMRRRRKPVLVSA